jgi:hypothetical protein
MAARSKAILKWLTKFVEPLPIVTFLLFAATGALYLATRDLVHDAERTAEKQLRAWVVPTGAKIDGAIELGVPLRFKVTFENAGKEVALDTVHSWGVSETFDVPGDAAGIPYIDPSKVNWPRIAGCDNPMFSSADAGRSIYPGAKYEDIRYVFSSGPTKEFINKKASFFVVGWFTYRTADKIHCSPYCLYWQPHRDRPIEQSTFEFCPKGGGPAN